MSIYFVKCCVKNGPIKIGYTSGDIRFRVKTIQTYCPYRIRLLFYIEGSLRYEYEIHKAVEKDRLYGEWFYPTRHVMKVVSDCKKGKFGTLKPKEINLKTF